MADFPDSIYEPRAIANRAGVVYDATKTKVFYAEDLNATNDEVVAIEEYLLNNPPVSSVVTDKVSVSSAEILALNTTPKVLVSAPGAGKYISILKITSQYNYGSVAYATNLLCQIRDTGSGDIHFVSGSIINGTANKIVTNWSANASKLVTENNTVDLNVNGGNPVNGDGTLDIYITYEIVTL